MKQIAAERRERVIGNFNHSYEKDFGVKTFQVKHRHSMYNLGLTHF